MERRWSRWSRTGRAGAAERRGDPCAAPLFPARFQNYITAGNTLRTRGAEARARIDTSRAK